MHASVWLVEGTTVAERQLGSFMADELIAMVCVCMYVCACVFMTQVRSSL